MVLKVDLQCHKCYRKIKKVLCKFPQIQDQVYDEKANTVTIKVVSCSPDCIKKKIICKGGDTIKSIDIKLPDKPKPKPPPPEKPEPPKKDAEPLPDPKPPTDPKPPIKPPPAPVPVPVTVPVTVTVTVPVGYPPYPHGSCCPECSEGRHGGPCLYGPPPSCQYDSCGGGRGYCVNRCDYFSEENTGACAIM